MSIVDWGAVKTLLKCQMTIHAKTRGRKTRKAKNAKSREFEPRNTPNTRKWGLEPETDF
jgi:hypothetical protein